MQEVKDTKPTPPKKPLIFYYLIAMVVVMLLNALLFPAVMEKQVVEVSYDQFLTMVDNGQVSEVAWEKEEEQIILSPPETMARRAITGPASGLTTDSGCSSSCGTTRISALPRPFPPRHLPC